MDKNRLKFRAEELENLLFKYKLDEDVKLLHSSLANLISECKNLKIDGFMSRKKMPGMHFFNEANLSQYKDLTDSYFLFRVELCGQISIP